MQLTELSEYEQYSMTKAKLKQFEAQFLEATLNYKVAEASGESEQATIFYKQITGYQAAANAIREVLSTMPEGEKPTTSNRVGPPSRR